MGFLDPKPLTPGALDAAATALLNNPASDLAGELTATYAPVTGSTAYARRGIYENFTEANFRKTRAAIARQRAGGAVARIAVYGDSNSNGYMAADAFGLYSRGYAERARGILEGDFGPSRDGIIMTRIGGANGRVDPRWVLGAGWAGFDSISQGVGGSGSIDGVGVTAGTADLTMTNVNSFDVWTTRYSGGSTGTEIWIDAETKTVVNSNGASTLVKTTVTTASVGTHTLHVKGRDGGGNVYVLGAEGYDNTQKGLRWTACGISGGTAGNWNTTGSTPWHNQQTAFGPNMPAPDLTVINLSINDHNASISETTYKNSMTTMINRAKAVGDVILVASAGGGQTPLDTWDEYLGYQRDLAATLNCGLINMQDRWGDYALASAAPYVLWGDVDHPSIAGYWDLGQALADGIRLAAGRAAN